MLATEGIDVGGAIRVLEEIGFINRAIPPSGSRYRATEHGLRRKAILFVFGGDYASLFLTANRRAAVGHSGHSGSGGICPHSTINAHRESFWPPATVSRRMASLDDQVPWSGVQARSLHAPRLTQCRCTSGMAVSSNQSQCCRMVMPRQHQQELMLGYIDNTADKQSFGNYCSCPVV
jgi:hypothetical protein